MARPGQQPNFDTLKAQLLKANRLYEDPSFPASTRYVERDGRKVAIQWLRPKDISANPKFISDDVSRFDLDQGELGDCWFISAAACLASARKDLLDRCVPPNQTFDKDYCGAFYFNFWCFNDWVQVIVDDRLPTVNRQLVYAHDTENPNEFWAALFEKAYAKLYGSYENIDGGFISDALVDFTGGISELVDITNKSTVSKQLFQSMMKSMSMQSMIGCSINATKVKEESLSNGLFAGHAYSITKISQLTFRGKDLKLLRVRNPWGTGEWNGAWSDKSPEIRSLTAGERKQLEVEQKDDGEFWMTYDDWLKNFEAVYICHLTPGDDFLDGQGYDGQKLVNWNAAVYTGQWIKGVNAGGCGNSPNEKLYWYNPQYLLALTSDNDDGDGDGLCTVIVSLMQRMSVSKTDTFISFSSFQVKPGTSDSKTYPPQTLARTGNSKPYVNMREVTQRLKLKPGKYVIMPSTFEPNQQNDFLLRIFTETAPRTQPLDGHTEVIKRDTAVDQLTQVFQKYAGADKAIDATELSGALLEVYPNTFPDGISAEAARSLMTMMDRDQSGLLDVTEFRKMVTEITYWKDAFLRFDKDKSGAIDTYELTDVFNSIGFKLSKTVMANLVRRYTGKNRQINLLDFIVCCSRIVCAYDFFSKNKNGDTLSLSLQEWMETISYY